MTAESLSIIVEQSLNSISLQDIKDAKKNPIKDQVFALLKVVAGDVLGAAESEMQAISDYKESEFFRKYACYLCELVETTPDDRYKFCQEIQDKAEDYSGNVILGMVDSLDNINKQEVFSKLTIARIHGFISVEEFFRLHSLLERIPYVDLAKLPYYKEDYFDESGDTELLFATGALKLASISAEDGNKYVLSALGENLLRFGIGVNIDVKREKGTELEPRTATKEDIDELFKV
jgi:hypothetical protein